MSMFVRQKKVLNGVRRYSCILQNNEQIPTQ